MAETRLPIATGPSPLSESATPALEVHDLTVSYHRKPVLWNVDLAVPPGKLVGIIGPNGAGKSTLIKAVMGLLPLSSGWVQVFGRPVDEQRDKVGYVPQRESVDWTFPVTAMDVVLMGRYGALPWWRRIGRRDRERARHCLEKVGMQPYANRQISNLSGGQQQRVFLARALAQDSQIYLMDEPFAGVDAATESAIVKLLHELREAGKTVLVVHHDLQTVRDYFDMVILLNMRLVAFGLTEEVFTPELLQKTYGGRLTILADVADAVAQAERGIAAPPATKTPQSERLIKLDPPNGL
ncbi:MAG: metal ABC transporter ATP-binding protein [Tepidisphaeraceae bacterium]